MQPPVRFRDPPPHPMKNCIWTAGLFVQGPLSFVAHLNPFLPALLFLSVWMDACIDLSAGAGHHRAGDCRGRASAAFELVRLYRGRDLAGKSRLRVRGARGTHTYPARSPSLWPSLPPPPSPALPWSCPLPWAPRWWFCCLFARYLEGWMCRVKSERLIQSPNHSPRPKWNYLSAMHDWCLLTLPPPPPLP